MQAARVGVGYGEGGVARQLALDSDRCLQRLRRMEIPIHPVDAVLLRRECAQGGHRREEIGILHHELELVKAVELHGAQRQVVRYTIVKEAEAAADYGLL